FTRRIVIWLGLQGRAFEQVPLAATEPADVDAIRAVNPLRRVPALALDDGTVLTECFAICDWLDETAPEQRLIPAEGLARREAMALVATASAATDKAVAMVYEKNRRPAEFQWPDWQDRLADQIRAGLAAVDARVPAEGFVAGEGPGGPDIAAVCLYDFVAVTNPWLLDPQPTRLAALAERANAHAVFGDSRPG
ncbi:MAG: glutathione S-transferase family protein, partial [Pseudomonadota bacterium]